MLLGWYVADLLTAVTHCTFDRCSWAGPLHRDATEHHDNPDDILRYSWWEISWRPLLATLPLTVIIPWCPWFAVPLVGGVALSTQAHVWAHRSSNCWGVSFFQSLGLLISPAEHDKHHKGGHNRGYAALCGWANPFLDSVLIGLDCLNGKRGIL